MVSPRNRTVATFGSTLMPWERASALASPTLSPLVTLPDRWTVPVRSRIDSRSVVLPLWNGPTIAMHRGPVLDLPLGAIGFHPLPPPRRVLADASRPNALPVVVSWQEVSGRGPGTPGCPDAAKVLRGQAKTRPGIRGNTVMCAGGSTSGAQLQVGDADRQVEPGLASERNRLQGDRAVRTADEHVGPETGPERRLGRTAAVLAGERAPRHPARGKDRPHDLPPGRGAHIEAEPADDARIDLPQPAGVAEGADHRFLGREDEPEAPRDVARQRADLNCARPGLRHEGSRPHQ